MTIFVYGTLKKDCCNHHILKTLIGELQRPVPVKTVEKYPMYKSESYFPYLEDQKGIGHQVKGEVYEISDNDADVLDRFEGVPTLYKRGTIKVSTGNVKLDCVCYFKAKESFDVINKELINEWIEE
jgi:gamma-glutamylaminecyclotransferase